MKKTIFFLLLSQFGFCQNSAYSEYIIKDSLSGFLFQSSGKLFVNNKRQSTFVLSQFEKIKTKNDLILSDDVFIADNGKECKDDREYFSDYNLGVNKSLLFENSCEEKRLVVENIQIPKWKIDSEEKMVNNYKVLKAEAIINDRNWIVYYTPKIKTIANPWRFYGIKGLIIKAEDETKQYTFELSKFEQKISEDSFENKNKYIEASFSQYKELSVKEHNEDIIKEVRKIAVDEDALNEFKSKLPPYECLEFIEKK